MARKAVGPTKDQFLASLSGVYRPVAEEILATLSYPESTRGLLAHALALVAARIPDLKMACPAGTARWESWESALPELYANAVALERQSGFLPKYDPAIENPWFNQHPAQPMLSLLHSDAQFRAPNERTKFQLNALRGLFLASYAAERYGNLNFRDVDGLCNHVRYAYSDPETVEFQWCERIIPGPDDRDTWPDSLEEAIAKRATKPRYHRGGVPAFFNWLQGLRALLRGLSAVEWSPAVPVPKSEQTLPPLPSEIPNPREDEPSLIIEPDVDDIAMTERAPRTSRRRIWIATKYPAIEEADAEALNPHRASAIELESVPAAEEVPILQATALEARHTSWRTAREAQRLPWDWEQLNTIEIHICTGAIAAATGGAEQLGAALAWLVLVTGQHLDAILGFPWRSNKVGGISPNGCWLRAIPSPSKAFTPKAHHDGLLEHAARIALCFPHPFPVAIQKLLKQFKGGSAPRTVGKALGVDATEADAVLRAFLEGIRSGNQRQVRLQPGRLRRVLANTLMQATQDKVLTYLVASLPGEEPPSGVYYMAYPVTHLQKVYAAAVNRMFV